MTQDPILALAGSFAANGERPAHPGAIPKDPATVAEIRAKARVVAAALGIGVPAATEKILTLWRAQPPAPPNPTLDLLRFRVKALEDRIAFGRRLYKRGAISND